MAVTMKNVVFWVIKTQFIPHRRHITSLLQRPASQCYVRFEVFMAVTMKNVVVWAIKTQFVPHRRHITSLLETGQLMLCKIWGFHGDDCEECHLLGCYFVFRCSVRRLIVTANVPSSPILVTLMMELLVPPKCWFLQEPHGVTSQKTAFFKLTLHSNLRLLNDVWAHTALMKPLRVSKSAVSICLLPVTEPCYKWQDAVIQDWFMCKWCTLKLVLLLSVRLRMKTSRVVSVLKGYALNDEILSCRQWMNSFGTHKTLKCSSLP
jgi:hypothetical protein